MPYQFFSRKDPQKLLTEELRRLLAEAQKMPPGVERDRILKKAQETEIRANLGSWANSPGLKSPT